VRQKKKRKRARRRLVAPARERVDVRHFTADSQRGRGPSRVGGRSEASPLLRREKEQQPSQQLGKEEGNTSAAVRELSRHSAEEGGRQGERTAPVHRKEALLARGEGPCARKGFWKNLTVLLSKKRRAPRLPRTGKRSSPTWRATGPTRRGRNIRSRSQNYSHWEGRSPS